MLLIARYWTVTYEIINCNKQFPLLSYSCHAKPSCQLCWALLFFPAMVFLSEDKNCKYQQCILCLTCQLMSHERVLPWTPSSSLLFFYFLSPFPPLSNPSETGSQNNFNTCSQKVSCARASFCYFKLTTSYPKTCLWAYPFLCKSNQASGALPSLDTDSFLYSGTAVCSDGWACRERLCFSPEIHSHEGRLSLLRRVSQSPQPLATPQAKCSMWCSSAQDHSSSRFSQAIQPLVRAMQDRLLHTPAPQRCSRAALLGWEEAGWILLWARRKSGDADVVLPWILGAALLLQTVQTFVCIIWLLWL